jgi:hypothetical protein
MKRRNIFSILQKHAISLQFEIVGEALNPAIQHNPSLAVLISKFIEDHLLPQPADSWVCNHIRRSLLGCT